MINDTHTNGSTLTNIRRTSGGLEWINQLLGAHAPTYVALREQLWNLIQSSNYFLQLVLREVTRSDILQKMLLINYHNNR